MRPAFTPDERAEFELAASAFLGMLERAEVVQSPAAKKDLNDIGIRLMDVLTRAREKHPSLGAVIFRDILIVPILLNGKLNGIQATSLGSVLDLDEPDDQPGDGDGDDTGPRDWWAEEPRQWFNDNEWKG